MHRPVSIPARQLLGSLDTLEALASYVINRDEQRREWLWEDADVLAAWVAKHRNGRPVTPLYKALAQQTGWSTRFVRDLVRTALAFPPELRERYPTSRGSGSRSVSGTATRGTPQSGTPTSACARSGITGAPASTSLRSLDTCGSA